jgi:hypothetical protein
MLGPREGGAPGVLWGFPNRSLGRRASGRRGGGQPGRRNGRSSGAACHHPRVASCANPVGVDASGHGESPAHVLLVLRIDLPYSFDLHADVGRESVDAELIDLDEISRRIADVQLDDVAG